MSSGNNVLCQEDTIIVRKAHIDDVPAMAELINSYGRQGIMLARSRHQLYQFIRDFVVAENDQGRIIGCGALSIVWSDLCEIRSLAVQDGWLGKGVGGLMVRALAREAQQLGVSRVFALTYRVGFFEHLGFHQVPHAELPHKIWGDCLNCPKYPNCDEVALMMQLDAEHKENN